jgi:hypothetical protein
MRGSGLISILTSGPDAQDTTLSERSSRGGSWCMDPRIRVKKGW